MTPEQLAEVKSLLERIEDAGGPVEEHRDSGDDGYWWIYYRTSIEEGEEGTAGAIRLDEEERWLEDSQKLIGALKLDARARGVGVHASDLRPIEGEDGILLPGGYWVGFSAGIKPAADHTVEVIAYCLAWLAAFGSSPAANGSDQLVPNGSAE